MDKRTRSLGGIKDMNALPDALFVVDVGHEEIAVHEARKLGIPVVAVVDSNCSPDGIDYVVPGNDDAMKAIQLYAAGIADAVLDGKAAVPAVPAGEDEFVELDEAGRARGGERLRRGGRGGTAAGEGGAPRVAPACQHPAQGAAARPRARDRLD